jgi:5'-methylthioadenosine phosphorylase
MDIGIIGGTGVYSSELFQTMDEVDLKTPYGQTSDKIRIAKLGDTEIAFIPRHGAKHTIPPHKVNSQANIWALKKLGVRKIVGLCAVGSLKENVKPGEIVVPDQYIDFTKHRKGTYYDGDPVAHVSSADPFCPCMRRMANETIEKLALPYHKKSTYVCIEGPRFSTRAESKLWRTMADIIGMTLFPEVHLARELELCYVCIATVTDYDVWAEKPVTIHGVIETMKKNNANVQNILKTLIPTVSKTLPHCQKEKECFCDEALRDAVIK